MCERSAFSRFGLGFMVVGLVVAAQPATAQNVVDQDQPNINCGWGTLSSWWAQAFETSASNVSGAGFYLQNFLSVGESETVNIHLWSGDPSTGGTMLAGASGTETLDGNASGWFDLFWAPVPVVTGTPYWLTLFSGNAEPGITVDCVQPGSVYPNGDVFGNFSTVETAPWVGSSSYLDFGDNADLTFRTFTTVTPEPATVTLLATGLIALVGVGMRRKKLGT
jgi:hypothetical protein